MNTPEYNDEIDITDAVKKTVEWTDDEPVKSKHRLFSNIKGFPKRIALVLSLTGAIATASCDRPDTTNPTVDIPPEILKSGITITEPQVFRSTGEKVYLWNTLVATCTDESWIYTISLSKGGSSFTSWNVVGESCNLWIKAIDNSENKNSTSKTVKVIYENNEVPEYTFYIPEATIFEWDKIIISLKQVFAWDTKTFAWNSDDYSISLKYNGEEIQTGYVVSEAGTSNLEQTLTNNKNWKSKTWTTTITTKEVDNNQAPEITRKYPDNQVPNILWWVVVNMTDNQLSFWDVVMYLWKDDKTEICTPSLKLEWSTNEIKSWEIIDQAGNYVYGLTDENWKFGYKTFPVNSESINLSGLNDLQLKVDQKVDNLLKWITIPDGLEITKVEIEINGQRSEIQPSGTPNRYEYTPTQAWNCHIYVTLKGEFGNTYVEKTKDPLTINDIEAVEYHPMPLTAITPEEVFPEITQIESWDKNIYEYTKEDGIAEIYVMREMMTIHGAGNYTGEQYEKLLSRAVTGLIEEMPPEYQKYEWIWPSTDNVNITDHSKITFQNLISLKWEHTNVMILSDLGDGRAKNFLEYAKSHPNNIFIFSCSITPQYYTYNEYKKYVFNQAVVDLCNQPNVLPFFSWGDTEVNNWVDIKIVQNGTHEADWDRMFNYASMGDSNEDNLPDSHMRVVIWTDPKWNSDMTNSKGSVVPHHFNERVIVSGRPIRPYYNKQWKLHWQTIPVNWSYTTSYTAPAAASKAQMIFGLRADASVDQLLEMMESTAEIDYTSLNWKRVPLKRHSPKNVVKKYLMTMDVPSGIKPWETIMLTKWFYKWVIYEWPGVEVYIDWKRVANTPENEALIKSHDPFELEYRRVNWANTELRKYGYLPWKTFKIRESVVDDQCRWLKISQDFNITVE